VHRLHGLSQRGACGLIGMDVSSYRYRSRRADDGPLRERLRGLAAIRRRFGCRRLAWLLDREGTKVNLKKVYRLYREEGLAVKRRRGRRRAIGARAPIIVPQAMNQRWSLDFVSDQSSAISSPPVGGSGCLTCSTTSTANAWRRYRTSRCQGCG
jgi:putative transposase